MRRRHGGGRRARSAPRELATHQRALRPTGGSLGPASGSGDPDGPATDPVVGSLGGTQPESCRESETPAFPGRYTAFTEPLAASLGDRRARRGADPVHARRRRSRPPSPRASGTSRPTATTLLLTRGAARLDPPASTTKPMGELRLGLFGNHWRVPAGHRLRVDLAQVDEPMWRRANLPATLSFKRRGARLAGALRINAEHRAAATGSR